ncbi:immunity 49 family protein [Gloeobacter violaceus]|uniref:Gll0074 protein n=1 Tax=Gloeobacter violaceus (strain ATCC 29082 / PCC 7421) TaxID=251221 RepID=Q7NPI1_GLOVI|nr:immunity 49 family protein [Gloeobacter violaceus]BAC88015.1 gll0074 [Gloeobacter violaceus PCC 7421]
MHFPHHAADLDSLQALYEQYKQQYAAALETLQRQKQNSLEQIYGAALGLAGCLAVLDNNDRELFQAIDRAALAVTDTLRLAQAPAGQRDAQLYTVSNDVCLYTTGSTAFTQARHWIEGFCLAVAARRDIQLETLLEISNELLRQSSTVAPEYAYLTIDALRAFSLRQPMQARRAQLALRSALQETQFDLQALQVRTSEVQLLVALLERNGKAFNDAMLKHLEAHREYWSAPGRRANPRGWLSIVGVGLATIFFKVGETLAVESHYLPDVLIRARFGG